ncbi:MAG: hypothetical protein EPN25_03765 [Nitrospirae bacterium]|nr:MAG: hypothetical protein EPN25_03765 [Nitrospirota bacterium]
MQRMKQRPQKRKPSKYDTFVEHPRYGRYPKITGLDPDRSSPHVFIHWNASDPEEVTEAVRSVLGWRPSFPDTGRRRVPGTAIAADTAAQQLATVAVTHYYDVERKCRDCGQMFIFFAVEQKHWYETLRFPLEADCVRCPLCRKKEHFLARRRAEYERLLKSASFS